MPAETVAAIAAEMARTGEHVAMGRFVGHLSDVALRECVDRLGETDLIRIGFVMDDGLDRMVRMLGEQRIAEIERVAARDGLADEARYVRERVA
jgi:hypothetical protein